ncbi:PAS domain-containing protein [Sphingomonas sp. AOB5]|uniref:PAS domain-containing protein n=1 Tax=Sphingomonas sp. AOB5 TaxID=3034017 RepID=UPI0023F6358F|nr:PAS domain-containing protein [Sphingomonas sp. AOB5]MDF7776194.1 PAS domain-containing protein [Sphingomonas sp. AOB5]
MSPVLPFLDHDGEMAQRIRDMDWSAHPLGNPETWPQPLRFALDTALASSFPTAIYWGPDFHLLYNDAWSSIPAERHPAALGKPGAEIWPEIWDIVGPQMQAAVASRTGFAAYDQPLSMMRAGSLRDTWWNYSFTPIRDESGKVLGLLNQGNETTRFVLAEKRRSAQVDRLRELFEQAPSAVALLSGADHVVEMANPAYLELIGGRDVLGKPLAEALPEVVDQGFIELLDRVRASGVAFRANGTPVQLQRIPGAEPETRVLDFVYQPIKNAGGQTRAIFVEATDVTDRANAEKALRHSQERLQIALDASLGIGIWDYDVPRDHVTGDARFAELFGMPPELLAAGGSMTAFYPLVHPADRERVRNAIQASMASGVPYHIEYRIVRPDGSERWLSAQGRCSFEDGKPQRFAGVSFDVTERRNAEEAAHAAAEDLQHAYETQAFIYALAEQQRGLDTPEAIMHLTAAALARRMRLDRVGFYRVFASGLIQFGPSWVSDKLPALEGTMSAEQVAFTAGRYRSGQTVVMRDTAREHPDQAMGRISPAGIGVPLLRNGIWVATMYVNSSETRDWSDEEIRFVEGVAEISWDAVERVGASQALRESEEKFRAIANSIDQMVWSTRPDGYHDYYNDRWYEYTGVPPGSTDGEAWNGMFHPEDQERAWAVWRHSLETGDHYRIEYRLRHHSGEYRWVLGSAQPVRDDAGTITRWFGTCTDIQDIVDAREVLSRSRAELERAVEERTRQLMTAEQQLRQAQKMEAVGQLTGGIAHDFNNMLAVVIGALDLLERRISQGRTDVERYVTAARDGATRAAALTQRLLAFSRQQPLAPVAVDANRTISEMTELLIRTLGEDIRIETRLPGSLRHAMADPSQLENMILNLSVNARDAMPQGGLLIIETDNCTIDGAEAIAFGIATGDYVMIAVADTGIGMSSTVAARAFDPFFTTKDVGKGTGLGLSQVFGFVRQSGGHVRIDSEEGRGTIVRVYLPVHEGDLAHIERNAAPAELPRGREDEIVLVVEDEERVRNYSVEALRELGYTVLDAPDGPHALRIIESGQSVTLLFTDIVMPEMTGRELAERASQHLPGLKLLFTSGYSREAVSSEADTVLAKPFSLDQLAIRIRAALDG